MRPSITPHLASIVLALSLSACGVAGEIASVGKAPKFSVPQVFDTDPTERSLASSGRRDGGLSAASTEPQQGNASLFRAGAAGLFQDQRAHTRGDIVTVRINVADKASFDNETARSRSGAEHASIASLLGVDKVIEHLLPGKQILNPGADSTSTNTGKGSTHRSETINLTLSAVVTDVTPNGTLAIRGRQEIRVNYELRELTITGFIRPQDIARDNSILHTQIAEARVAYGGRGQLTQVQQARYGQQIFNALFPF
jgi:flagellar L-ring protein FlgH